MTSYAAPTTTISEFYHVIESRITQDIDILLQRGGKPNISAAAREFNVPEQRFRARWNGRRSNQDVVLWNRKLKEHEELAVCTYLDRSDKFELLFMISGCANGVLRRAHVDEGPPPQVSEHWLAAFWNGTTPSILCANNQSKRSTERTHKTSIQIALSRHYPKSSKYTTSSGPHPQAPNCSTQHSLT